MRFVRGLTPTSWFRLDRHEEGAGAAGGGEGTAAGGGGGAGESAPGAGEGAPAKTFTQAELDKIVSERLAREKAKFADHDDLKKKAARLDEIEAANKTELEKAQAERDAAKSERDAAKAEAKATRIRAAAISAASEAGAIKPDDVVAVLGPDAIKVNEDGTLEGVKEAVAAILDDRPHWKKATTPGGSADGGARGGQSADFKAAPKEDFAAELAKHGLRSQS